MQHEPSPATTSMSDVESSEFKVIHVDPFTGILFEPEPPYERYNKVPNTNSITFASAEDAIQYCQDTVAAYPHVQCLVTGLPAGIQNEFGDT